MLLVSMLALLLFFSIMGMEIAWAIGVACMGYLVLSQLLVDFPTPFVLFSQQMTVGIDSFSLLSIPMFIFAGALMNAAGVTHRLVAVASALVGHIRGGLANVGVTANFIMSGISGSALADAAATGSVLVPAMREKNYPPAFSCAVIASAATVGPIIPPSISFLLLGAIVNVSVGQLFMGGIVPGILMFLAMLAITYWLAVRMNLPREPRPTLREVRVSLVDGAAALVAPIIVVGSIVAGIATPSEAAAVAVFYTLFLGFAVYRSLSLRAFLESASATALISAVIMLTVATSQMFAWLAVQEHLGRILTDFMLGISQQPFVLLAMINVLLLFLGMFMEPLPIMLILAPILFPLLGGLGVDPVHFGVVMVLNMMIGMITPPIGLNLFVLSVIGGVDVISIFRAALPYFAVLVLVLLLITYFPALTLWIPTLMFR